MELLRTRIFPGINRCNGHQGRRSHVQYMKSLGINGDNRGLILLANELEPVMTAVTRAQGRAPERVSDALYGTTIECLIAFQEQVVVIGISYGENK